MNLSGGRGASIAASVLVHGLVVAVGWASATREPPPAPPMRVYAVDIVSPPPNVAGEMPDEMPVPAESAPSDPIAPVPEPVAPELAPPEPEPAPPPPAPAKNAAPAKAVPTRAAPPRPAPAKPAAAAPSKSTGSGAPKQVAGPNPVASSAGGAGLNVRTEGAAFVDQAYLVNIVYRVKRYFRRPQAARSDRAEVCFRIEQNGAASEIRIAESSGSAAFRLAVMEAVEQAGVHREFGSLPPAYTADFLPVCLEIQPDR